MDLAKLLFSSFAFSIARLFFSASEMGIGTRRSSARNLRTYSRAPAAFSHGTRFDEIKYHASDSSPRLYGPTGRSRCFSASTSILRRCLLLTSKADRTCFSCTSSVWEPARDHVSGTANVIAYFAISGFTFGCRMMSISAALVRAYMTYFSRARAKMNEFGPYSENLSTSRSSAMSWPVVCSSSYDSEKPMIQYRMKSYAS
mmetsp:Transcript_17376/g.66180  ORF Transcript_17376/g.66180 Transcript_17376/m.66180 type:complete len:201 (-) Transcript_17376:719-1321(-)